MLTGSEKEHINEIAEDLSIQFEDPEQVPIVILAYLSEEDLEYVTERRTELYGHMFYDYPFGRSCLLIMTYLAVKIGFDEYDDRYWDHFMDFMAPLDLDSNKCTAVGKRIKECMKQYGFHVIEDGRKYVNTILFNAGVPAKHANTFFESLYNEYCRYHRSNDPRIMNVMLENIESKFQEKQSTILTVQSFLSNMNYSRRMCENVITRFSQENQSDDYLQDLGVLEKPFNTWLNHGRFKKISKTIEKTLGIELDTSSFECRFILPRTSVQNQQCTLVLESKEKFGYQEEFTISTSRSEEGYFTSASSYELDEDCVLYGMRAILNGECIFETEPLGHLIFNKNGELKDRLFPGCNYIVYASENDINIDVNTAYTDRYIVDITEEIPNGFKCILNGKEQIVGKTGKDYVHFDTDEFPIQIYGGANEIIKGFSQHPVLTIGSTLKQISLSLGKVDEKSESHYFKTEGGIAKIDLNDYYIAENSEYRLEIRSGTKKYKFYYVIINDLKIESDRDIGLSGEMHITANGNKKVYKYTKYDRFINVPLLLTNTQVNAKIHSPAPFYSLSLKNPDWKPISSIVEDPIMLNNNLAVEPGRVTSTSCMLNFMKGNVRLGPMLFSKPSMGQCNFKINNQLDLINSSIGKVDVFLLINNQKYKLFSTGSEYVLDIDRGNGVVLFTASDIPDEIHLYCNYVKDSSSIVEIPLQDGEPVLVTYDFYVDYLIKEKRSGSDEKTVLKGTDSTSSHIENYSELEKKNNPYLAMSNEEAYGLVCKGDCRAAYYLGDRIKFKNIDIAKFIHSKSVPSNQIDMFDKQKHGSNAYSLRAYSSSASLYYSLNLGEIEKRYLYIAKSMNDPYAEKLLKLIDMYEKKTLKK